MHYRTAQNPNVLIMDDEEGTRFALETLFYKAGLNPRLAGTAEHGISKFKSGLKFDMVITDLKTPFKTGIDLIREVRAIDKQIPIIVISGAFTPEEISEVRSMGVTHFLVKPFRHSKLVDLALELLKLKAEVKAA